MEDGQLPERDSGPDRGEDRPDGDAPFLIRVGNGPELGEGGCRTGGELIVDLPRPEGVEDAALGRTLGTEAPAHERAELVHRRRPPPGHGQGFAPEIGDIGQAAVVKGPADGREEHDEVGLATTPAADGLEGGRGATAEFTQGPLELGQRRRVRREIRGASPATPSLAPR